MPDAYNEVIKAVNIRDVLNSYGINIQGNRCLCPFHADNNPSMSIDTKKNIAHCFSCGEGGNVVTFIRKYENKVNNNPSFSNIDAIKKAAEIGNLKIDIDDSQPADVRSKRYDEEQIRMLDDNQYLQRFFNYNLVTEEGKQCAAYIKERGISDDISKEMMLGYAPNRDFTGVLLDKALNVGLATASAANRLKNRLIIPIGDEYGNIVAFCGRSLNNEQPKYLLIPETKVFHKSEILFNYDKAKSNAYNNEIFIVEGFMDVIGAKKLGLHNTIGLMGTAITDKHIGLLKKLNSKLVLALDNDEAGKNAMIKQLPTLLKEGFNVEVIDIAKIGNYKDFGDIGNTDISIDEINKVRESAFQFLMREQYKLSGSIDDIQNVYKKMVNDGLINTKADDLKYIECALSYNSSFSKDDIYDLIHPVEIESRRKSKVLELRDKLMEDFFYKSLEEYLNDFKGERVDASYIKNDLSGFCKKCYQTFLNNPNVFINKTSQIMFGNVIGETLHNDKDYEAFKKEQYFEYENSFEKVKLFTKNGYANLVLNDAQKEFIKNKFKLSKNNLNNIDPNIEELYILQLSKVSNIFPNISTKSRLLVDEFIPMSLHRTQFAVFSYSNIFNESQLSLIDPKYKTADGKHFKSILLYLDKDKELHLTNENLLKNQKKKEQQESEKQNIKTNTSKSTRSECLIDKDSVTIKNEFAYVAITAGIVKINMKNLKLISETQYKLNCPSNFSFSLYSNDRKFVKKMTVSDIANELEIHSKEDIKNMENEEFMKERD